MKELNSIILAAGKGTRLKSNRSKVCHEINGRPILHFVCDICQQLKIKKNVVVVGHQKQQVEKILPQNFSSVYQAQQNGTGHAVKIVFDQVKNLAGDTLILCGDTPLLTSSVVKKLVNHHRRTKATCTFLTAIIDEPKGYGRIFRDDKRKVLEIKEHKNCSNQERKINEINVGVYIIDSAVLKKEIKRIQKNKVKNEYYLTDIIDLLISQNKKVEAVVSTDTNVVFGINSRHDLVQATEILRQRKINQLLDNGVTIVDPSSTYIGHDVKIGKDTVIFPFTVIEGNVVIGKDCQVGPFAHIRPFTKLKDCVTIGNFTELSRSVVGNKSIMKHFSFLGDAVVAENVNIGAGTITANYDGKLKSQNKIGNNSFVGSGSVLIAPLKIPNNTVIGAGSVVTKNLKIPTNAVIFGNPAKVKKVK